MTFSKNELLAEKLRRLDSEQLRSYQPHTKQLRLHQAPHEIRVVATGNQWGKTLAGTVDVLWTVGKCHPYRENYSGQVHGRVMGPDFDTLSKTILGYCRKMCPVFPAKVGDFQWPGLWKESWDKALTWNQSEHILRLADGSSLEFNSYSQDVASLAGTQKHIIMFDEPPPRPEILGENMARQITLKTNMIFTMTPYRAPQFLYEFLVIGAASRPDKILIITASSSENPYSSPDVLNNIGAMNISEAEKGARLRGEWTTDWGRVWKEYGEHNKIPVFLPPNEWTRTLVLDPHDEKPCFVIWVARDDATGKDFVYREAQLTGTFEMVSKQIIERSQGEVITRYLMDPKSGSQAATLRGSKTRLEEFRKYISRFMPAKPNNTDTSIEAVRRRVQDRPGGPLLCVMENCPTVHNQMLAYTWRPELPSGESRKSAEVLRRNDEGPACVMYYVNYGHDYDRAASVGGFAEGGIAGGYII